jgi:hypothetical protein
MISFQAPIVSTKNIIRGDDGQYTRLDRTELFGLIGLMSKEYLKGEDSYLSQEHDTIKNEHRGIWSRFVLREEQSTAPNGFTSGYEIFV